MFAKLSALVGSSSALPFQIVQEYGRGWGHWTHSSGVLNADGSSVSIFRISAKGELDPMLIAARNGVKRLKMVCVRSAVVEIVNDRAHMRISVSLCAAETS